MRRRYRVDVGRCPISGFGVSHSPTIHANPQFVLVRFLSIAPAATLSSRNGRARRDGNVGTTHGRTLVAAAAAQPACTRSGQPAPGRLRRAPAVTVAATARRLPDLCRAGILPADPSLPAHSALQQVGLPAGTASRLGSIMLAHAWLRRMRLRHLRSLPFPAVKRHARLITWKDPRRSGQQEPAGAGWSACYPPVMSNWPSPPCWTYRVRRHTTSSAARTLQGLPSIESCRHCRARAIAWTSDRHPCPPRAGGSCNVAPRSSRCWIRC